MREDILRALEQDVMEKCASPRNTFGPGMFCHIKAVVQNALRFAEPYGADAEVVAIAAWLHDYASIVDEALYLEHHIHSAAMAAEILAPMGLPGAQIERVQMCIRSHRGSAVMEKTTPEAQCVADADAASHFDSVPALLYLAYAVRGCAIAEGVGFVRGKLARSYEKLSPRGRALCEEQYRAAMRVLAGE